MGIREALGVGHGSGTLRQDGATVNALESIETLESLVETMNVVLLSEPGRFAIQSAS